MPDLAIVPRLFTSSVLVIPIPVSKIVRVLFSLFGMIEISRLGSDSNTLLSVSPWYLILSRASEELETNSLRNTLLLE